MKTDKMTVLEKIGFGSGDGAVNVVWSAVSLILMYFYTDVYELNPAHIGWLMFLPRLIDAFSDLFMGMYTDTHTTRWGRYRPYLMIFAVPFGLATMLLFTTPNFNYTGKLIYAYATYILMILVFTAVTIPYISLPGVITADPKDRLSANGYRLFFAKVASLAVNIFVPIYAGYYSSKHGEAALPKGYQIAMGVMALMATLLFIFCFFTIKERVKHPNDHKPAGQQLKVLMQNSQWRVLALVCLVGTMGYVLRGQVAMYYAKYFLGGDGKLQSAFLATGIIGNILAMPVSTLITKRYCKVKLFRWSQVLTFVLCVMMYFMVKPTLVASVSSSGTITSYIVTPVMITSSFIFYFLINFVVDLQGPVFWSIISEAVDYGQVHLGKRVAGMAFGGISWCQKMGMSLAGGIGGVLLVVFNYAEPINKVAQAQSDFTINGFSLMLTIIPGIFHLGMGLLMFKYFITDKFYNEKVREFVTHDMD